MDANSSLVLARPVYGQQDLSPVLPPAGFVLDFAVYPATNQGGQASVALFAAARVAGRYADVFGGRLPGAIQIVAVEAERGVVYSRNGERGKPAPLPLVMNFDPQPTPRGVAPVESAEVYFAVDLCAHLGLPANRATYTVFLWLDEMASAPRLVDVPGAQARPPTPPAWPFVLARDPDSPRPAEGLPALKEQGSRMVGLASGRFSLLGLDFRSRAVEWVSASGGAAVSFSFDPRSVFSGPGWLDAPEPPRRAFLVLCGAGQLSSIVTVEVA
jgi:hypothetical protein